MKRITIEETRKSLIEQIKEKLRIYHDCYHFEGGIDGCYLVSGQKCSCISLRLMENAVVFMLSINEELSFEVSDNYLTLESLDKIRETICTENHSLDIWAADMSDTHGDSHTMLLYRPLAALPDSDDEAISYLNEVICANWKRFSANAWHYVFYPDPLDNNHYIVAHFD